MDRQHVLAQLGATIDADGSADDPGFIGPGTPTRRVRVVRTRDLAVLATASGPEPVASLIELALEAAIASHKGAGGVRIERHKPEGVGAMRNEVARLRAEVDGLQRTEVFNDG